MRRHAFYMVLVLLYGIYLIPGPVCSYAWHRKQTDPPHLNKTRPTRSPNKNKTRSIQTTQTPSPSSPSHSKHANVTSLPLGENNTSSQAPANKCNTFSQLARKHKVKQTLKELFEKHRKEYERNKKTNKEVSNAERFAEIKDLLHDNHTRDSNPRRRRWDYDESYDWENGGKDYEIPSDKPKKETKLEKFAKNWQKNAIKYIFLFSFLCMILLCCLACCKRLFVKLWDMVIWHCSEWRDVALRRDPTYTRAKQYALDFGIKLDYDQYKKMKHTYEDGLKKYGYGSNVDLSGR